jgi:hypothetical protein
MDGLTAQAKNSIESLCILIKELNIPLLRGSIVDSLLVHPDFPALSALSDILDRWDIPNASLKINKSKLEGEELSGPFIANANISGQQLVVVKAIRKEKVVYFDVKGADKEVDYSEFRRNWDGIMLIAEKKEDSGDPDYYGSLIRFWLKKASFPLLVFLFIVPVFRIGYFYWFINPLMAILIGFKCLGVLICLMLLWLTVSKRAIRWVCQSGSQNGCNDLLSSQASKVTSWLSWSEVGVFYFIGTLVFCLMESDSFALLAILNFTCIPFICYSLWYQLTNKKLCRLCLSVLAVLFCESLLCIVWLGSTKIGFHDYFGASVLIKLAYALLAPPMVWFFLRPFFLEAGSALSLQKELNKFKANRRLFFQLLENQNFYQTGEDLCAISLGDNSAKTVITMVTNPFCDPCALAHARLEKWLDNKKDLLVEIVFLSEASDKDDRSKVGKHMISLSRDGNQSTLRESIRNWYGQGSNKKYQRWAEKFPVDIYSDSDAVLEKHKKWCAETNISSTPTFLINGHKLLNPYKLEDIENFF